MSGTIVVRLRALAKVLDAQRTHWDGCVDSHPLCAIAWAADVIEARDATIATLTAEIERLRTAGDALAEVADEWPELVDAWEEARRG